MYVEHVLYIKDDEFVRIISCKHVLYLHLESCMHLFSSREPQKGIQGHVGQPPKLELNLNLNLNLKLKLKLGRTVLSHTLGSIKDVIRVKYGTSITVNRYFQSSFCLPFDISMRLL